MIFVPYTDVQRQGRVHSVASRMQGLSWVGITGKRLRDKDQCAESLLGSAFRSNTPGRRAHEKEERAGLSRGKSWAEMCPKKGLRRPHGVCGVGMVLLSWARGQGAPCVVYPWLVGCPWSLDEVTLGGPRWWAGQPSSAKAVPEEG